MIDQLKRFFSITILTFFYCFGILISRILKNPGSHSKSCSGKILAIGTFHNPNWFTAHITPLSQSGIDEILVVADGFTFEIPKVRVIVPNKYFSKIFSRAFAKFVWSIWYGYKLKPDIYMGYAIFPAATTALILSRVMRSKCCFQLTSGKLELEGGGNSAENRLLSSLGKPSSWIENLSHKLTNEMDMLVVRGQEAYDYARNIGFQGQLNIITGSVDIPLEISSFSQRNIDMIFVGRLNSRKKPDVFVSVVKELARIKPDIKAAIVGDGPDIQLVENLVDAHGLRNNIEILGLRRDVAELVGNSKIFVLTSRWEGVSIAMLEAMAAGTVPVVNNVGDLRDVVKTEDSGFLIEDNDMASFVQYIMLLLKNEEMWNRCSERAREIVINKSSRTAVAEQWKDAINSILQLS